MGRKAGYGRGRRNWLSRRKLEGKGGRHYLITKRVGKYRAKLSAGTRLLSLLVLCNIEPKARTLELELGGGERGSTILAAGEALYFWPEAH